MSSTEVLIVAAEASSSLYALRLLQLWKKEGREIKAFGVGTPEMEDCGFECIGRAEDLAVVGLSEVVSKLKPIKRVFDDLIRLAQSRRPQLVILMDFPDFNLRLAARLKKMGLRIVYYISPQLWAWRTGRVKLVRRYVDEMIPILPFEEDFYQNHGVKARFHGHPLIDEIKGYPWTLEKVLLERSRLGIGKDQVVLGLMPGSRGSEIKNHLQVQIETAEHLSKNFSQLEVILCVAPTLNLEGLKRTLPQYKINIRLIQRDPLEMISLTDVILCASGTATLMVGLLQKPMVIMYKVSAFSAWLGRRLVSNFKYCGLPNLILGRSVVTEVLQEDATASNLSSVLSPLLENQSLRAEQAAELSKLREALGVVGVTERISSHILSIIETNRVEESTLPQIGLRGI